MLFYGLERKFDRSIPFALIVKKDSRDIQSLLSLLLIFICLEFDMLSFLYSKECIKSPLRSFGSNQVDFGGITSPASAIANKSSIDVGYKANATL